MQEVDDTLKRNDGMFAKQKCRMERNLICKELWETGAPVLLKAWTEPQNMQYRQGFTTAITVWSITSAKKIRVGNEGVTYSEPAQKDLMETIFVG